MIFQTVDNAIPHSNLSMEDRMANPTFFEKLITYMLILLSTAFILGTFTLSLIVTSMVIYLRHTGWLVSHESLILSCIILVLCFFILLFAKWLTIWFTESHNKTSKITFSILMTLAMGICIIYWLPAKEAYFSPTLVSDDKRFTGGPYPDAVSLMKLKSEGYTTIISLLDPLLLPSEPFLIREEDKAVASLGLSLVRIPLISGTVTSLDANKRIEALAKSEANEKYYVHSYRDPDRVLLFLKQINQFHIASSKTPLTLTTITPAIISEPTIKSAAAINGHTSIDLERGTTIQLDDHVIVSPKPTTSEFEQYFLMVRNVVSLNPDERPAQISEFIQSLKTHHINYYSMPIQLYPYDPEVVLKVVEKIKSLSGKVLVYSYNMPPQSAAISAFMLSYLTNLPALPENLFAAMPMQNGSVKTVSPNVAIGPRPDEMEFKDYLFERGIRSIGYAGPCDSNEATVDEQQAQDAGLKWVCLKMNNTIVLNELKKNGPWYVYGPVLPLVEHDLAKRLGKLMPDHTPQGNS